jgi:hypothetical protein
MSGPFTAQAMYGGPPVVEATPTGVPDHAGTGAPEPNRRVSASPAGIGNPVLVLLALLGLAFLLINVDLKFSAAVSA